MVVTVNYTHIYWYNQTNLISFADGVMNIFPASVLEARTSLYYDHKCCKIISAFNQVELVNIQAF